MVGRPAKRRRKVITKGKEMADALNIDSFHYLATRFCAYMAFMIIMNTIALPWMSHQTALCLIA